MPASLSADEALLDAREIAEALRMTKRGAIKRADVEAWPFVASRARGGMRRLYPIATLPEPVRAALQLAQALAAGDAASQQAQAESAKERSARRTAHTQSLWQRYEAAPQSLKDVAGRRLRALHTVESLVRAGQPLVQAREAVAAQLQRDGMPVSSVASLGRWAASVHGLHRSDWLAALVPDYLGRTAKADIPEQAWDLFKADFLRLEQPPAAQCYARLERIAAQRGWSLPSLRTFQRRLASIPRGVRVLMRQGQEAFDRTFPAQERDRSVFHALEAVNADGHKFDVFVRSPLGHVVRPILVGVQDLYSGKILGWRLAETESADLARLAFRDMVERYGIPSKVWLDNGRGFASKLLTGGAPNRYRFKVREEDPTGMLVALGCEIHWATPYHGQAKPIERAWRDLASTVAKHPAFAGAYTGNTPDAKPENYASHAVPWETFVRVLGEEITAHNARAKRRTRVCGGIHSFDDVFAASYAQGTIRKATSEQLRQMLLAADVVRTDRDSGSVRLAGNRYWSEALAEHAGSKLLVRFDPDALHQSVQCYTLANVYLGEAQCIAAVGFADTQAAREHQRAKGQHRRAVRAQRDAEVRMRVAEVAAQLVPPPPETLPQAGVVAPIFGQAGKPRYSPDAARSAPEPLARTGTDDARETKLASMLERMQEQQMKERL